MDQLLDNEGLPVDFEPLSLPEMLNDTEDSEYRLTPNSPENHLLVGYWNEGVIIGPQQPGGVVVTMRPPSRTVPASWMDSDAIHHGCA
jgi:hypothetical protein